LDEEFDVIEVGGGFWGSVDVRIKLKIRIFKSENHDKMNY